MGATAVLNQSDSAREKSLLRSFSAIHYSRFDASNTDVSDSYTKDHRGSPLALDHWNEVTLNRRKGCHRTKPSRSRTCIPSNIRGELQAPPFTKAGLPHPKNNNNKFQRGQSLFTADVAQDIARNPVKENKHELQRFVERISGENDAMRRRATVSSALSHGSILMSERYKSAEHHNGFRRDYKIGDSIRSPSHMIDEPTLEQILQGVNALSKHDFAFIKRSDGSYSYAILAYSSMERVKGTLSMEDSMTFVINSAGATKTVRRRYWSHYVRRVSVEREHRRPDKFVTKTPSVPRCSPSIDKHLKAYSAMLCRREGTPPVLCQEIQEETSCDPPSIIEFIAQADDECSLISSVSDRARAQSRRRTC
mmetsp:Transcript_25774/g.44001  ORF Transcript_25774/g.44001 Transcript_25774/m.44001 type:complete len:365 (+) Transcript_25774:120-1214(+)